MRNKRSLIALIFFAVAALVLTSNSQAQGEYEKLSKASLKNLKGVPVIVYVQDELAKAGVYESDIKTAVEVKLRTAGIKVLTEQEMFKTPGLQALFVEVLGMQVADLDIYAVCVNLKLSQEVSLLRDPGISLIADTWTKSRMAYGGGRNKMFKIIDIVNLFVNPFINDYLSVNPKK